VYPGDLAPTVTENLLAPTEGAVFTDAKIFVSGRLEDDHQIAQGQVAIVNAAGFYLTSSTNGTFSTTAFNPATSNNYRTAFLNSPGSPGSNFSFTTPAIPAGSYTVYVRGIDQNGLITPTPSVRHVTVNPPNSQPPVANFAAPVCTQNVCVFDGTTSTDENPAALTYSWSFGNPTGTGTSTSTAPKPTKTYATAGTFTVTLTVKDEFGLSSVPATRTVTITEPTNNTPPTAVFNQPSCSALVCNFSAVGSTDANVGDIITYSWTWADATANGTSSSMAHTFPAAGTYHVVLTVTDGWGKTATAFRDIAVA
jgi:PKD repeat protein